MSYKGDLVSRRDAIEAIEKAKMAQTPDGEIYVAKYNAEMNIQLLPSAQPELTDEQSIAHLQSSGWMQRHDKEMYESGLKEQLADDSDSYDSLLPTVQTEVIRCKDCKYWVVEEDGAYCDYNIVGVRGVEDGSGFCSDANMKDALDPHIVQFVKSKMAIEALPSAQPKYEPVKAEDFAKTMSENTIYSFIAWYGTVLELIEKRGFTICKKTM